MDDAHRIVGEGYDAIAGTYERWAASFRSPTLATLERLLAELEPGSRVLDLGCGNGIPVARALVERGHRVTGADLSAGQLERARRNVPDAEYVHADALEVDFPPASFDAVVCAFVLGHVPRDEHLPLLRRVHGWLRPGAPALLTFGLSDTARHVEDWLGAPMFFSSFPPETSRRLLAEAGFELEWDRELPVEETGHGVVSFLWTLSRRLP